MDNLISLLSMGRLADGLARAVGWSPVGRRLEFSGAEGPLAPRLGAGPASVVALAGEDLVVECTGRAAVPAASPMRLRLSPRHRGWTARSLMLARIAVVVQEEPAAGGSGAVAIAIVRVVR